MNGIGEEMMGMLLYQTSDGHPAAALLQRARNVFVKSKADTPRPFCWGPSAGVGPRANKEATFRAAAPPPRSGPRAVQ